MTSLAQRSGKRVKAKPRIRNVGLGFDLRELMADLGDIPLERVRLQPPPGTATVEDVTANNDSESGRGIVELVDGTLVEKTMGAPEAEAALALGGYIFQWNEDLDFGLALGADGVVRLFKDTARAPNFAFYRHDRFEGGKYQGQVPWMYSDLAVEVLSPSNTKREMAKKRREYFMAGTRPVWEVDLASETVVVYREANRGGLLKTTDVLNGEDVQPGFKLPIAKWFKRLKLK